MGIYKELLSKEKVISVTGLGYVGLPLALEFAKHFRVIGFDINEDRIKMMEKNIDPSKELDTEAFMGCDIEFTSDPNRLKEAHFHVIGVPTDIDEHKVPNLLPLLEASKSVGRALKLDGYVVYESTVYPGCTEEDCLPILMDEFRKNNPTPRFDVVAEMPFKLGYSPERIVPGDKVRTLTKVIKIVSGNDAEALEEIANVYGHIIKAGIYKASSIKVAEAAKVIENTQRDINISLMNELAIIFDKMGIDTTEVIEAAGTKWNFHKYYPGLVGGHCISIDPFYLIHKSKQFGHDPEVIAAGRRVNDYIPNFIAKKVVQKLIELGKNPGESKVLVMGITFKENVADIRNSKVVDLVLELMTYSIVVDVIDPNANIDEVIREYEIHLLDSSGKDYDAVIISTGHDQFREMTTEQYKSLGRGDTLFFDINGIRKPTEFEAYWQL